MLWLPELFSKKDVYFGAKFEERIGAEVVEFDCVIELPELKIGNWSRYLTALFGMDADNSLNEDQINGKEDSRREGEAESKSFCLLNAMSDLLMLPKDMLVDRSIRKEVCPTLGLSIITRILCNFTPDEFSPDTVPGTVLDALSYESFLKRRLSDKDLICSFPYTAPPVLYYPPSLADVAEKVELGDAGGSPQLWRNISVVQRKGYTSDDELDELDSPLTSIIDKTSTPRVNGGNGNHKDMVLQSNTSERGMNVILMGTAYLPPLSVSIYFIGDVGDSRIRGLVRRYT